MTFRVAVPADVPSLFDVRTSVLQNHMSVEDLARVGVTPASVAAGLTGSGRGWVAEENGAIVAFSMADADEATVFAMFVRPAFEGRGLGRVLMAEAEQWLFGMGCKSIWLLTDSNPAVRANGFYQHLGWAAGSVQSDGQRRYTKQRMPAVASDQLVIRPETAADAAAIRLVTERAFAGRWYASGTEQDIVDALRAEGALTVSLVAERDGRVLGHVAFSPAFAADGSHGWYTLGPISVEPGVQRRGIGSQLITEGIRALRELGAAGCIVVGDTNYYPRFGFIPQPEVAPPGHPTEYFMVLPLGRPSPQCVIGFHPVFERLSGEG